MKVIKNASGSYFVQGKGFTAKSPLSATAYADKDVASAVDCIVNVGLGPVTTEDVTIDPNIKQNADGSSWAVYFVRAKQVRPDGSINTHKLNPSKRRFATRDEAVHHGFRFMEIEKHYGFWVQKTFDPVNAYVNRVTGKTNPEVGKARTNR